MATITTTTREFILVLADIIQTEMSLADDHVFIYNQDFKIPEYDDLFIVLSYLGAPRALANNNEIIVDSVTGNVSENQCLNQLENIAIDVMSRNPDARVRKEEVLMALTSVFSKAQQEQYQFKIFSQPSSFIDISEAEGAARINRYQITVPLMTSYRKSKIIEYYNQFSYTVKDN